jgi:PAS domain S-box-containing protein
MKMPRGSSSRRQRRPGRSARGVTLGVATALLAVGARIVLQLRRLSAQLSRSEARRRDLIELAPDAFFLADLSGRFTDVNQAACRLLGYERDALVGKRIVDLIPAEDIPRLTAERTALLVPGQVARSEWALLGRDGRRRTVEVSANIVSGGRWQAFVRDIGERKRAEDALRSSEEEQRLLADAGALLATSLDFEKTLTSLGGLMVHELADWCIVDVIEDGRRPKRLKVVSAEPGHQALAARLEQLRIDRRLPHLAGLVLESRRPFLVERVTPDWLASNTQSAEHLEILRGLDPRSIMGVPLTVRGTVRGVLILISSRPGRAYGTRDLHMAEALAERAALAIENGLLYQTAVSATQYRDEVLGVVAHDLRNPVAAIMMQASALRRGEPDPDRRSQKPVDAILRAAKRMNRLIGDLLDVRLIESGELGLEEAWLSPRQLVGDAAEAQGPLAASASLEVRLQVADGLPDLRGDPHRLLQVLENLVGNAIKFTPAGGCITVGAVPGDCEVTFWVADTGCGISPEGLAHVFDRFWQARKGQHGAGLGLPIARGIVEAHGGRIWLESRLGRGTIVFFTVPVARAPSERQRPAAPMH